MTTQKYALNAGSYSDQVAKVDTYRVNKSQTVTTRPRNELPRTNDQFFQFSPDRARPTMSEEVKTESKTETKADLMEAPEGKQSVLILGGCGFIGRHLVKYLVDNKLATKIRVADKSMPATSYLAEDVKAAFDQKKIVEFKQSDLAKPDHVKRLFADAKFNYVVNLCGETRFGLNEADYKVKCLDTATAVAPVAKENGVEKWVEVSTAQVYESSSKKPNTEEGKIKPWTVQANFRHKAEEEVTKSGPPAVILRPAVVYGPGDLTGITPRITCAAVYKKQKETMKFLWDKDLHLNVVHVRDLVAAIWVAATELKAGTVYNVAEPQDVTQGILNEHLGAMFKIKTGFHGDILSNVAKLNMKGAAEHSNDKHVPVWTKLCQENKILNTPLSPYIDKELLYNNHLFVDGTKITKDSKFAYKEKLTEASLNEVVQSFIKQGLFPPVLS